MRIVSVKSSVISLPFEMGGPHTSFAGKPWTHLDILLVRVETEDGRVGWGESFGHAAIPSTRAALDSIVAPLVVGQDARDINGLTRRTLHATHLLGRNGSFVYAYSGVEIALWDLQGKRSGLSLQQLLGGGDKTELPAYASLLPYGDPEIVARNTAAAWAQGYRAIKLHEVTHEAVAASRAAAADARIMVDVNCAWSVPTACAMADRLIDQDIFWLEEPVWPPEDCDGLAQVRDRGIPIAAGENVAGVFGFKALIEAGAIDIAQPSVTKLGGIDEMRKVIDLCHQSGITATPHCPYFGPGFIASLHLNAALIEKPLVEVLWLEMEANPFDPWVRIENGKCRVPTGPGLGCDPDPAVMEKYRVGDIVRTAADARRRDDGQSLWSSHLPA